MKQQISEDIIKFLNCFGFWHTASCRKVGALFHVCGGWQRLGGQQMARQRQKLR